MTASQPRDSNHRASRTVGRVNDARPSSLDAVEQTPGRQTEMKANNFGPELFEEGAGFGVEGFAGGRGN
jgi:hypothetical protein